MKRQLILSTVLTAAACAADALACPAVLSAGDLGQALGSGLKRNQLRLHAIEAQDGKRLWRAEPLQVDPMSDVNVRLSPADGANTLADPLTAQDRIVLRMEGFGEKRDG